MFLTSPGPADPARRLLGRTVCWLENPRPAPFPLQQSSTIPGHLKSPCQPGQFVEMASMVESVPRNTALNKRQLKKRVAFAKAHSLLKGWTLEKCQKVDFSHESSVELNHSRRKYCKDLLEPAWIRDSPRKQLSLVAEKSWSGVTSSMGVYERFAGWKGISIAYNIKKY